MVLTSSRRKTKESKGERSAWISSSRKQQEAERNGETRDGSAAEERRQESSQNPDDRGKSTSRACEGREGTDQREYYTVSTELAAPARSLLPDVWEVDGESEERSSEHQCAGRATP